TQLVACQDRVVADVVDLVEAVGTMAQDHIGGGAGRRRRVRCGDFKEAVENAAEAVRPGDLAPGIDAHRNSAGGGLGIVKGGVSTAVVKEAVVASGVDVKPDDLARGVDAVCNGAARGQGIIEGGVSTTAEKEAVYAGVVVVLADDLARVVDAVCKGA